MKPPFDLAADLDTPVSAFLKLRSFHPRFLLESVEGGERVGRYSFIGFGEALEVRILADDGQPPIRVSIDGKNADVPSGHAGSPFPFLREVLERAPKPAVADGVPFHGGLVGVSGYELVRCIERLPARAAARADEPMAAYVAPRSLLVFDHLTRRVALLHDGPDDERRALRGEIGRALAGALPSQRERRRLEAPAPSLDPAAFCAAVARAKHHITLGDVFQLVLSVRFEGRCEIEPFTAYRALRLFNPSPYMFFFDFGDMQVAGSSPEALVRLSGRRASLRPIAGTRPRGAEDAEDRRLETELLADAKEGAEHVMLVDLARNDLGRVAIPGSIAVEPYRAIERYSHVMHIVSGVTGVLAPEHDAFDLFAAAFPAGTVTGAPKVRAMELIDELEPVRRGLYAGTAGYFGHGGAMDQAIAIRTLTFASGRYAYQAGAGIVADSVPEREHAEVLAKSAALLEALRVAEEGL